MAEYYPKWILVIRKKALALFNKYSIPKWMLFLFDSFAVFLTFLVAYLLRFNFVVSDFLLAHSVHHALIAVAVYALFFLVFRSFSGLIRHATLTDISLVFAATSSALMVLVLLSIITRIFGLGKSLTIPLSVILIHYGLITIMLFVSRISVKLLFHFATSSRRNLRNVLIYGAGELGFIIKRVIMSDPKNEINVAGFIDDNKQLQGKKINSIPVLNPNMLNKEFIHKHKIKTIILAINNLTQSRKSEIIHSAIDLGMEVLKTPETEKWLNRKMIIQDLQKVKLEDLLGRDLTKIENGIIGKRVLVTGAAGSVGAEIVRQLLRFNPGEVILVDQAETPMFQIENELRIKFRSEMFQFILADITNFKKMENIFREHHPEIVFHAAAYKHVPLMEENPHEAFLVNVGGTKILIDLAVKYGISKFVFISTDKCFNPSGVMGASKRIGEMILQIRNKQLEVKTQFIITRFGNVLGSNGSVIPLFSQQISNGGPVTVTHPEISRYFLTIPDACELILESAFLDQGGEIFDFDMGDPVKITDLARKMIRLCGLEPGKDIEITFTGLRPGEKLNEERQEGTEAIQPTGNPRIRIVRVDEPDYAELKSRIEVILSNLYNLSKQEVIDAMQKIVNGVDNVR
jgi:FlaA1/EpsC-like NDP-sugar epimerase